MKRNELALFAGAGGGLLGTKLLGWNTVCAVEIDAYCRETLFRRQEDGCLPTFPIWDDVKTFDGKPWRGAVDVISGGFPCQDISCANPKSKGLAGERSGLVFEMLRIIGEVRPKIIISENAKELRTRGLGEILFHLDLMGYDAKWGVLGARHVGANHHRKRMWIISQVRGQNICMVKKSANMQSFGREQRDLRSRDKQTGSNVSGRNNKKNASNTNRETIREQQRRPSRESRENKKISRITDWWDTPRFEGVDDGSPNRMDRIKTTGNMQVPAVVKLAWKVLGE